MTLNGVLTFLKKTFPENLQENFDNSGIQVFAGERECSGIYLSLDVNNSTIANAKQKGCNLICTHHPLIFKPLRQLDATHYKQSLLYKLIQNEISLYSLHTNLDKVYCLKTAEILNLNNVSPLFPEPGLDAIGIGSRGTLPKALPLRLLLEKTAAAFSATHLVYSGDLDKSISSVAIMNGSGGSEVFALLDTIDCIITGDVKYHEAYDAALSGTALIDAGHFWTEHFFMDHLREELTKFLTKNKTDTAIHIDSSEKNPLQLYIPGGSE